MAVKAAPQPKPRGTFPTQPWLVRHWQQALLAVAAVAVAVLLTAVVVFRLKEARARGWESLSMAMSHAAQGRRGEAVQVLDGVLSANRSGPLAVQAHMMRG